MAVLKAPIVIIGERDARWLAAVLDDLVERRALPPALVERARVLAGDCLVVVSGGQPAAEVLLTFSEAATLAHVSVSTMRRWVSSGRVVPAVRSGGVVRLRRGDVERLVC